MGKSSKRKPKPHNASELAASVYARGTEVAAPVKLRTKSNTHHRKALQGVLAEFQQVAQPPPFQHNTNMFLFQSGPPVMLSELTRQHEAVALA